MKHFSLILVPACFGLILHSTGCSSVSPAVRRPIPPGAAALGFTKCVIQETPTAADIAPGRNGNCKWFSGQWYSKTQPPLDLY